MRSALFAFFGAVIGVSAAAQSDRSHDELSQRVDALEQGLARYRQTQTKDWLTPRRAAEIRALVADVIHDASTRASMLQSDVEGKNSVDAGWDDGFFIDFETADGEKHEIEVGGQIQIRHVYNRQQDARGEDTSRSGFENRRTKLDIEGEIHIVHYGVTLNVAEDTGLGGLNEVRIGYEIADDLVVEFGKFRSAMLREGDVSSKRQTLVERSLVAREFDQGRNEGVELSYRTDRIRLRGALMDSSMFTDAHETWVASARAEWLVCGDKWGTFNDFASFPGDKPAFMVGIGALYETTERDVVEDEDVYRWTADASLELGGCNIFAALIGNHPMEESDLERTDQFGAVIQGGLFITDTTEIFGQYQWGDTDGDFDDLSVVTVGVNHYFEGHDLKLTFDVGYGINSVEGSWASQGAGWREDRPRQDGQIVARTQLQLLF